MNCSIPYCNASVVQKIEEAHLFNDWGVSILAEYPVHYNIFTWYYCDEHRRKEFSNP